MAENNNRPNRPQGRQKYVTDNSKGVNRRGEGLNSGPVGGGARPGSGGRRSASGGGTTRAGGSRSLIGIIAAAVLLLGGGGGLFGSGLLGGGAQAPSGYVYTTPAPSVSTPKPQTNQSAQNPYASLFPGASGGANVNASSAGLDTGVASGARAKRTVIRGGGQDSVTIMVYMCGTDLESRSSMATRDLMEMTKATLADNVNLIVYTGGCTRWNNQVVSAGTNQIWQVKGGGLKCLVQNAGNVSMTKPSTLTSFIQWCGKNYPADRNELILWDHGGGSVSGYGYDQKFAQSGSMTLAGINTALADAGVSFDFIGFDACLMATVETGLMLDSYADYMIASEETEPGIGWYYTDWLTKLSANTSMSTLEIGKNIVDDFVRTCASQTRGQSATLSVVDLAELAHTVPAPMRAFSQSLSALIADKEYKLISTARSNTREFARSTVIDQIDLVHFARNLGTDEAAALAEALQGAVKYNRTSSDMTNCYGLSIYFPYRKTSTVDAAVSTYSAIGMDESYSQCIRQFASLELSGQVASGGMSNPYGSLIGNPYGSSSSYSSYGSADMISSLLGAFLGGDFSSMPGYSTGNTGFYSDRALSLEDTVQYLADNRFDAGNLVWRRNADGDYVIALSEEQWSLVEGLDLSLFYDDGYGYVDMGLDNVFDFDEDGNLLAPTDGTWLAINGQPVAYYHDYSTDEMIAGHIPVLLNGERAELLVRFDDENPRGVIIGARTVYTGEETATVAKNYLDPDAEEGELAVLRAGDTLDFLCDYYSYDGVYEDSYLLGEQMLVTEEMELSNVALGEGAVNVMYRFTDLYQQHYWTPALIG